jgi:hypothetical protein
MPGPTTRGGILGRRRGVIPTASSDGLALLTQQLASPDPILAKVAAEACPNELRETLGLSPPNASRATLIRLPGVQGVKTGSAPSVSSSVFPSPPNPDPKRLRWDPEKRAFRLKSHPAKCDCAGRRSALTGEPLDCGLCDGRKGRSARFLPEPAPATCRYCGRPSAYGWAQQICHRCERYRTSIEGGHMAQHSIVDRRGWTGPATIGDDTLLLTIQRRLTQSENRNANLEEKALKKAKRLAKSAKFAEAA